MNKEIPDRRGTATFSIIFDGSASANYETLASLFGGFLYQEGRRMVWRDIKALHRRDAVTVLQLMGCHNVTEYERTSPRHHGVVNHSITTSRRRDTSTNHCGCYYRIILVDGTTRQFLKESRFRDALKRDCENVASAWGPDGKRYFVPKEA